MKLMRPQDVAPTIRPDSPAHVAGRMVHRRMMMPALGGPASLDISYNNYRAGEGGRRPYAYTHDEFCYTADGEMESDNRGQRAHTVPGTFMWRPAGAITDGLFIRKDTLTICAFAPGRKNDWSHRLRPDEIPEWDGRPETQFVPRRIHWSDVQPSSFPPAPEAPGIIYREIFSSKQEASALVDVSHVSLAVGASYRPLVGDKDQVWWLESGQLEFAAEGRIANLTPHDFLYCAPGLAIDRVRAVADSVLIGFAASLIPQVSARGALAAGAEGRP